MFGNWNKKSGNTGSGSSTGGSGNAGGSNVGGGSTSKGSGSKPEKSKQPKRLDRFDRQEAAKEKEEDMFVLVDKKNPIVKDGPLVSSWDYWPPPNADDDQPKGKDKDGFETVPLRLDTSHQSTSKQQPKKK
ncbi:hypothetical protein F4777DRAFT_49852 [Nemania sp. FL0916]|nr:hypothetical protein F4777DRAFT_49852 [Nemania sp. FL0916]